MHLQKLWGQCKKGISDSQYKPRWVKLTSKPTTCDIIGCHSQSSCSLTHTDLATLTKNGFNFKSNTHSSLVVCASHAMQTYWILNPIISCKGCGIKPSSGKTSHERCPPNPSCNAYYQQNTEFAETFSESDEICFSCYCFHFQIVNQDQLKSENYVLKLLIKEIKESTSDSNLEAAAAKASLLAAEMLLNQRAMLLPKLHSLFVLWLKYMPPERSNSSDYRASLPSTRWLLVRLAKQLSPRISFCCKVKKKHGTVICRKNGDILQDLTFALARQSLPDLTEESQPQRGGTFPDKLATIEEASSAINHRLQAQAQKLLSKYCNAKTLQNIRVTELLKAIDPVLLSFIKKHSR